MAIDRFKITYVERDSNPGFTRMFVSAYESAGPSKSAWILLVETAGKTLQQVKDDVAAKVAAALGAHPDLSEEVGTERTIP